MAIVPSRLLRSNAIDLLESCGWEDPWQVYAATEKGWAGSKPLPRELKVQATIFGLFLELFDNLVFLNYVVVTDEIKSGKKNNSHIASLTILSALCNDGHAILTLCRTGLDIQARTLLRSFVEKLDLFVAVYTDGSVAADYIENSTFEGSRDFFYKRISGKKLKRLARLGFEKFIGGQSSPIADWHWGDWREELDLMLGAAVHPNHTVGMISLFPNMGRRSMENIGLGGHPNNGSIRTLRDGMIAAMPVSIMALNRHLFDPNVDVDASGLTMLANAKSSVGRSAKLNVVFCMNYWNENTVA